MENDAVDRLRELLAKSAERRRAGRWRFVRKIGVLIGIFRAMFQRGHRRGWWSRPGISLFQKL